MSDGAGSVLADALTAMRLCACDPALGGLVLRGEGRALDEVVVRLAAVLPAGAPVRRLPAASDADALDGGIDLAAALAGRGKRDAPGLLEHLKGGLLIVPMAERLKPAIAARLAKALDDDHAFTIAALDESEAEERVPDSLADRLAFWIDVNLEPRPSEPDASTTGAAVSLDMAATALAEAAAALGIGSARADLLALRAARALAVCEGRLEPAQTDLDRAARLVLAPRATRLPLPPEASEEPPPNPGNDATDGEVQADDGGKAADRVLAAACAAIDPALMARLAAGKGRGEGRHAGGPGERRRSQTRGRRVGVRPGEPRGGARLALAETLRAAAPWQGVRGRSDRLLVRRSDLRIWRFEAHARLVTIFAVDASGSAALARLAETKGAVELLLSQAYVQRAGAALIAFRNAGAELLLPPTRSLTRARRALAELPGGGGTPLASGIAAAGVLATSVRARGRTPFVVLLSDGRANIAADGRAGRVAAEHDALAAARALAAAGTKAIFVDTGARPRPEAAQLAAAMDARYLPLPYANAARLEAAVSALAPRRP